MVVRNEELPLAVEEVGTVIGQVRGKTLSYAARTARLHAGAGQTGTRHDVAGTEEATGGLIRLRGQSAGGAGFVGEL